MTYNVQIDPATKSTVCIKLYKNVQNVNELRRKIVKGEIDCCMVKPALVWDPFQLVIAANKALTSEKPTTKSVFTEILFNLSLSKNITQSLQKFGIDDKDKNLLVLTVIKNAEMAADTSAFAQINGEEVDITELSKFSDIDSIKKAYKISDEENKSIDLLDSIVSRICAKDIL